MGAAADWQHVICGILRDDETADWPAVGSRMGDIEPKRQPKWQHAGIDGEAAPGRKRHALGANRALARIRAELGGDS